MPSCCAWPQARSASSHLANMTGYAVALAEAALRVYAVRNTPVRHRWMCSAAGRSPGASVVVGFIERPLEPDPLVFCAVEVPDEVAVDAVLATHPGEGSADAARVDGA